MPDEVYTMFVPLIAVIAVIILAYFGTNWFLKKYKRITSGKYIKIMERTMLSQDKYLLLIKASQRVYLLGVTGQSIQKIDDFDPEEFPEPETQSGPDFANMLSAFTNTVRLKDRLGKFGERRDDGKK